MSFPALTTVAIIIHFGDPGLTRRAIASMLAADPPPGRIVVMDNGPGILPSDEEWRDTVRVHHVGRNIGFAAAVNQAIVSEPSASGYWLFNNDATALPSTLSALLESAQRHTAALISSVIETELGERWYERASFAPWRMFTRHEPPTGTDGETVESAASWRRVPYVPATSLYLPSAATREIGLLDERFFLYGEDVDYCIRAIRSGWRLVTTTRSVVLHRPSQGTTPSQRERMIAAASFRLTARYYPAFILPAIPISMAAGLRQALRKHEWWRFTHRALGYLDVIARRRAGPV